MQRVFTDKQGHFDRGDCPERPHWWWERYKGMSLPLHEVIQAGLIEIDRQRDLARSKQKVRQYRKV